MMVPSSSEINNKTHELSLLEIMPPEVLTGKFIGNSPKASSVTLIRTLSNLGQTCKDLRKKVDECWGTFILQSGRIFFYIPIYAKKLNINESEIAEKSLSSIKKIFPVILKWEHLDFDKWDKIAPQILKDAMMGRSRQCILNHKDNPELWIMLETNAQLEKINLKTHASQYIDLKEKANPISRQCCPCMARSNNWIAICSRIGDTQREISIIHIGANMDLYGSICHTITGLKEVRQLFCENEFLYVLCIDEEKSKFLRYDSKNWDCPPLEFAFSDCNVEQFYIGCNEIFFTFFGKENQYQLSAIKKDSWFLCSEADLKEAPLQNNAPLLKAMDDALLTITPSPDSNIIAPCAMLDVLHVNDSVIIKECLLELPVNALEIEDFLIVFDKIFILVQHEWKYSIKCFDLKNGMLVKNIPLITSGTTNFKPTLLAEPPYIKLYYSINLHNRWTCEGTGVMTLNYGTDLEPIIVEETVEKIELI